MHAPGAHPIISTRMLWSVYDNKIMPCCIPPGVGVHALLNPDCVLSVYIVDWKPLPFSREIASCRVASIPGRF